MTLPDSLYDIAALREMESRAAAALDDAFEPMRRAGEAGWREALGRWPGSQSMLVICGPGNNGGDGYVLATNALQAGREVLVTHLPSQQPKGPLAQRAYDAYVQAGGRIHAFEGSLPEAGLIVDALFGIGLSRAPEGPSQALIEAINQSCVPVLSLDVPSGVDASRASVPGVAVRACATIEFIAPKLGLATGPALDHVGSRELAMLDIAGSIFDGVSPVAERLEAPMLSRWLTPRARNSHKGVHGRVLAIGGAAGHGGAIMLAAEATLRSGAGLVEVLTDGVHVPALLARLPEAMCRDVDAEDVPFAGRIDPADVLLVGPGLGQGEWGTVWLSRALASGKALVLDADALNLIARDDLAVPADSILTPHPGEAGRLLGCSAAEVQADRLQAAQRLCQQHDAVVVLKGAGTIIAAPGRLPRVVDAGNPGMAVGGMGDVLAGVIAALRAQRLGAFDAASAGALLHAVAGDRAAADGGQRGLLPSDLMRWLRRLANPESRS